MSLWSGWRDWCIVSLSVVDCVFSVFRTFFLEDQTRLSDGPSLFVLRYLIHVSCRYATPIILACHYAIDGFRWQLYPLYLQLFISLVFTKQERPENLLNPTGIIKGKRTAIAYRTLAPATNLNPSTVRVSSSAPFLTALSFTTLSESRESSDVGVLSRIFRRFWCISSLFDFNFSSDGHQRIGVETGFFSRVYVYSFRVLSWFVEGAGKRLASGTVWCTEGLAAYGTSFESVRITVASLINAFRLTLKWKSSVMRVSGLTLKYTALWKQALIVSRIILLLTSFTLCSLCPIPIFPEPSGGWGCGVEELQFVAKQLEVLSEMGSALGSVAKGATHAKFNAKTQKRLSESTDSSAFNNPKSQSRVVTPVRWHFSCVVFYPIEIHRHKQESRYNWLPGGVKSITDIAKVLKLPKFCLEYLLNVETHSIMMAPLSKKRRKYPIVFLSHGIGLMATAQATLCQELASHGSIVVALEHTDGSALSTSVLSNFSRHQPFLGSFSFRDATVLLPHNIRKRVRMRGGKEACKTGLPPGKPERFVKKDLLCEAGRQIEDDASALFELMGSGISYKNDDRFQNATDVIAPKQRRNFGRCVEMESSETRDLEKDDYGETLSPELNFRRSQLLIRVAEIRAAYKAMAQMSETSGCWIKDRVDWEASSVIGFGFGGASALLTCLLDHVDAVVASAAMTFSTPNPDPVSSCESNLALSCVSDGGASSSSATTSLPSKRSHFHRIPQQHYDLYGDGTMDYTYEKMMNTDRNKGGTSASPNHENGLQIPVIPPPAFRSCVLLCPWLDALEESEFNLKRLIRNRAGASLPETWARDVPPGTERLLQNFLLITTPEQVNEKLKNQIRLIKLIKDALGDRTILQFSRCSRLDFTDISQIAPRIFRWLRLSGSRCPQKTALMVNRTIRNFLNHQYRSSLFRAAANGLPPAFSKAAHRNAAQHYGYRESLAAKTKTLSALDKRGRLTQPSRASRTAATTVRGTVSSRGVQDMAVSPTQYPNGSPVASGLREPRNASILFANDSVTSNPRRSQEIFSADCERYEEVLLNRRRRQRDENRNKGQNLSAVPLSSESLKWLGLPGGHVVVNGGGGAAEPFSLSHVLRSRLRPSTLKALRLAGVPDHYIRSLGGLNSPSVTRELGKMLVGHGMGTTDGWQNYRYDIMEGVSQFVDEEDTRRQRQNQLASKNQHFCIDSTVAEICHI